MTTMFEHFVRYTRSRDEAAAAGLHARLSQLVKLELPLPRGSGVVSVPKPNRADTVQDVLLHLLRPGKAALVLATLVRSNPWMREVVETVESGGQPADEPLARANRVLERYLRTMLATRAHRKWKQDSRELGASNDSGKEPEAEVQLIERRPEVFQALDAACHAAAEKLTPDQAKRFVEDYEQVLALAVGETDMDSLVRQAIDADAQLAARPFEEARVKARNRLQQRHKRARDRLKETIEILAESGTLRREEADDARVAVDRLLTRRQIRPAKGVHEGKAS